MREIEFGIRSLFIIARDDADSLLGVVSPMALLLLASEGSPDQVQDRMIRAATDNGCVEYCCFGSSSEALHDYIDGILEDQGALDVVTTWHADEPIEEAVYYFVNLAGSRPPILVAAVANDSELVRALEDAIKEQI